MNLSRGLKPVLIERRLKSWKIEHNFKWNQPYLSRGSNSLNSVSGQINRIRIKNQIFRHQEPTRHALYKLQETLLQMVETIKFYNNV